MDKENGMSWMDRWKREWLRLDEEREIANELGTSLIESERRNARLHNALLAILKEVDVYGLDCADQIQAALSRELKE